MDKKKLPSKLIPAATIILVREKKKALEVYLLKRNTKSRFMGGLYVFPGGMVDPDDMGFNIWEPHLDLGQTQIKNQLCKNDFPFEDNLGFCIAGIRETLEEAGVFIASGNNKNIADIKNIAEYRLKSDLSKSWFKNKIINENWILSLSHLKKWSHWITPEQMKKRFDTLFFIARMPEDQRCIPDKKETQTGIWITPKKALEENLKGSIPMSPPTLTTLIQMLGMANLQEMSQTLQTHSWPDSIMPRTVKSSKGPVVLLPWDPLYETAMEINVLDTLHKVLAPDHSFSRVWNDKGHWKPIEI